MRTEGYGYVDMPVNPGRHRLYVDCWRPTGHGGYDTVVSEMRRLFVGHTNQLDDVKYIGPSVPFEVRSRRRWLLRHKHIFFSLARNVVGDRLGQKGIC